MNRPEQAAALRRAGLTWKAIAERLGYASPSAVANAARYASDPGFRQRRLAGLRQAREAEWDRIGVDAPQSRANPPHPRIYDGVMDGSALGDVMSRRRAP